MSTKTTNWDLSEAWPYGCGSSVMTESDYARFSDGNRAVLTRATLIVSMMRRLRSALSRSLMMTGYQR